MPVTLATWDGWHNRVLMTSVSSAEAQKTMKELFNKNPGLEWRNDPSYWWSKKRGN